MSTPSPSSRWLENKVVLITGAASGLGRELARQLADHGATIAGVDLFQDGLISLENELAQKGRRCAWEVANVIDATGLQAAVRALEAKLGPTHMLIASAGLGLETSALKFNADDIARVILVNLTGVSNSVGAVLPGMLERRHGHIVAISSLASFRGVPRMLGYCASKSGLNAFMEGLRVEVAPYGVDTSLICPGWIRTPMTEKIDAPMPKLMNVDEAVRYIISAIRRRKVFYAFPRSIAWRLSLLRWLPTSISDWLISTMIRKLKKE